MLAEASTWLTRGGKGSSGPLKPSALGSSKFATISPVGKLSRSTVSWCEDTTEIMPAAIRSLGNSPAVERQLDDTAAAIRIRLSQSSAGVGLS
jgi:hypothetical protein